MAKAPYSESHVSQRGSKQADETTFVRQHHRLALGLDVDGQKTPYGKEAEGKSSVANSQGKSY